MAVRVAAATIAETNDTSNVTTYASGSFTPVANKLYLLGVVHTDTAPEATVPTVATTTGLAFVQVGSSIAFGTIASNVYRLTLFRAMKPSGLSTGTYTVTLADAATGAASVLIEADQVVTTGTDGANAVGTVWTNVADAGANPSITTGAFASGNNGLAAFFGFNSATAATASNSGWAVIGDASYATPSTGITALFRGANNATAICTHASADWAGIAVELISEAVPTILVPQPPPPPKRKAALTAAILAGACFFSPFPIPTPDVIDGSPAEQNAAARMAPTVLQYQGVAGPVVVPAPVVVPPLAWAPTYPSRNRLPPPLGAARMPASVADRFDAPAVVDTTIGWLPTAPDQIGRRKPAVERERLSAPVFVPDVTQPVTALAWTPVYPTVIQAHVARRAQPTTPPVWPIYVPDVTAPVAALSWEATYPDRIPTPTRLHAARQQVDADAPTYVPDVTAPVTALAWGPDYPDRPVRAKRLTDAPQPAAPAFVPDVTQAVTALSWGADYPDRIVRPRLAPERAPAFVLDRFDPPGTVAAPDLVPGVYPATIGRKASRAHLLASQGEFGYVVEVPVLSWTGSFPDRVPWAARKTSERTTTVQPIYLADVTVTAPDLSWRPQYPTDPRLAVARRAQQAPEPVAPIVVADVTSPVVARSWAPSYPDAARALRLATAQQAAFFRDRFDAPGTVVAPDLSWQRAQPDAVVRRKRLVEAPQAVAPLYVPDVTAPVTALSWRGTQPDRVDRPVRLRAAQQLAFAFDRFDAPGSVDVPALVAPVYPAAVGRTRVRPAGSVVAPLTVSPATEQWLPIAPSFVWRRVPPTRGSVEAPVYVLDVTLPAPYGSWAPTHVDKVQPAVRLWWHLAAVQNVDPIAITVTAGDAPACRRLEAAALNRRLAASAIVRRLTPTALNRRLEPTGCHS